MSSPRGFRITCLLALAPWAALTAQEYWHDDTGKGTVRITTFKPFLKGEGNGFLTGSMFLGGSVRAGKWIRVEGDLPLARAGVTGGSGPGESSLRVGNPYLGLRFSSEGGLLVGQLGVRVPLAADPGTSIGERADEVGWMTDLDRFEAFTPKLLMVRGGVELRHVTPEGILLGAKAGGSFLATTRSNVIGDSEELFADYGARAGYQGRAVLAAIGITGRALVTESGLSFSERTTHQLTGTVEWRKGLVRPSLLVRLPLEQEMKQAMHAVVGVGLALAF